MGLTFPDVLPFLRGSTKPCSATAVPGVNGCSQHGMLWGIPQKALGFVYFCATLMYLTAAFWYRFTKLTLVAAHSFVHALARTAALRVGMGPEGLLLVEVATNAVLMFVLYDVASRFAQRRLKRRIAALEASNAKLSTDVKKLTRSNLELTKFNKDLTQQVGSVLQLGADSAKLGLDVEQALALAPLVDFAAKGRADGRTQNQAAVSDAEVSDILKLFSNFDKIHKCADDVQAAAKRNTLALLVRMLSGLAVNPTLRGEVRAALLSVLGDVERVAWSTLSNRFFTKWDSQQLEALMVQMVGADVANLYDLKHTRVAAMLMLALLMQKECVMV